MKRVDHAEASSHFIKSKEHLEFHDRRLWDLRQKRDREAEAIPEWEELRALASAIKEHTLSHLGDYLEQFERNATANGMRVHWARDAAEHNQIVYDLLGKQGVEILVKSKSMLTDECCGFGGTFSVSEEPVSARMGYDKVSDHHAAGAEYIVTPDPSCMMHQKGCAERLGLGLKFIHIAQVLNGARA